MAIDLDLTAIATKLQKLYDPKIDPERITAEELIDTIKQFQARYGEQPDGFIGPRTQQLLDAPRFCRVADKVSEARQVCRWDETNWDGTQWQGTPRNVLLSICIDGDIPRMSRVEFETLVLSAYKSWSEFSAVDFAITNDKTSANCLIHTSNIDGRGQVLGWSGLPCGKDAQIEQMYDITEDWTRDLLFSTIAHESGHFLGLEHGGKGLMQPYAVDGILGPMAGYDQQQIVLRYGAKLVVNTPPTPPTPPPVVPPTVPGSQQITINIGGVNKYIGTVQTVA